MIDPLLFVRLGDARRARPRRFRLFNAHLDQYFRFGRDDLAKNIAFRYALPSPWALTIRPKIPGRISGNFHGKMVQSFSSVEDDNCSFGIFQ